MAKLRISIEVEYDLADGETIEDVGSVMEHATNTIISDSYLTGHQNFRSSVRGYNFAIKEGDDDQALLPDGADGCDYVLNEGHRGFWITIGNLSVHPVKTDEGVVVDIYPKGDEGSDPIASTYAFDLEGVLDV